MIPTQPQQGLAICGLRVGDVQSKNFGPVRFPREVEPTDRVYDLTSRPLLQSHHRTPQLQAQLANRSSFASSNPIFRHACQENRRPERQPTLSSAQGLLQINIRCVDFL